ncbi:MAG TPA: polymer-forming cytoskeletal protein [Gammaproteobacteria bacterium]|nr:polymer-forming cytoskeletal protein [Gammaproteobacteria bacterium]
MWKKDEVSQAQPETAVRPYAPAETRAERAIIGPSITIKGELSGDEDLIIEGRVEGKIDLKQHKITIGKKGVVRADMHAKMISVEGEVQGTLSGEEQVVLCKSSSVRGDIIAPRVTLEDGAKFKGSIDMEPKAQDKQRASNTVSLEGKPPMTSSDPGRSAFDAPKPDAGIKRM